MFFCLPHQQIIKVLFAENKGIIGNVPEGYTIRMHRYDLLCTITAHAFRQITLVNCAAYDRHAFGFIDAALAQKDM